MKNLGVLLALVALAGCANKGDPSVCGSLAARLPYPAKTAEDQKQVVYSCMERWAARLARGPDSADAVSRAAFAACEDALAFYRDKLVKDGEIQIGELLPKDATDQFWKRRTLFIAVQTRAGNCYSDA